MVNLLLRISSASITLRPLYSGLSCHKTKAKDTKAIELEVKAQPGGEWGIQNGKQVSSFFLEITVSFSLCPLFFPLFPYGQFPLEEEAGKPTQAGTQGLEGRYWDTALNQEGHSLGHFPRHLFYNVFPCLSPPWSLWFLESVMMIPCFSLWKKVFCLSWATTFFLCLTWSPRPPLLGLPLNQLTHSLPHLLPPYPLAGSQLQQQLLYRGPERHRRTSVPRTAPLLPAAALPPPFPPFKARRQSLRLIAQEIQLRIF